MRPVTRITPYPYPATIDVNYTQYSNFLNKNPYLNIPSIFGSPTEFTILNIVNFMAAATIYNNNKANWGNITATGKLVLKFLVSNVFSKGSFNPGAAYGDQRGFLVNNFGTFCSYCGMRINDTSLAVEHMLPKSNFPDVMMQDVNFLLACSPCNSQNKGTQPGWSQAWANTPTPPPVTYPRLKEYGILLYTWPVNTTITTSSSNVNAYHGFIASMYYQGTTNLVPATDSLSLNTVLLSTQNNTVRANVYNSSTNTMVPTDVQVKYTGANLPETRMIALVGMNNAVPGDPRVTDRRMVNRTVAWLNAISAFSFMSAILSLPPTTPNKAAMVAAAFQQLLTNASNSGFYEIWVGVLNYLSPVAPNSIYAEFKNATNGNNLYFPGTDATLLP